ncbi:unnamed protein product [Triticum turgidum subsp. durum]|uniref:RING-type E3 ubiquitin transferase n=1 Tax=Triticum turgidum subsp. durum TaxID=4567 RepID=A0A9R0TRN5_TRITD|nr:unnamed protein product [Triticum turgidum subsp. durum]
MATVRRVAGLSLLGREIKAGDDGFVGAPEAAVTTPEPGGPSATAARITPAVLFITVVLAVVLLVCGLMHILRRLFLKSHRANARAEAVERQLQQLFHLHEDGAGPGLDQAAIDALPAFAYAELDGSSGAKGQRQFDCAVCLSEFAADDRLRLLPLCGHAFHVACIDTWLRSSSTCPLCRTVLSVRAPSAVAAAADAAGEPDIEEQKQEQEDASKEVVVASTVVLPVRLGRFKNVQGNNNTAVDVEAGTSSRLDARRCFSMGSSYQYVLAEDNLVVSVHWRPGDGSAAMRPGVTTASSDQQGKKVCAASRGDSFSVSKIWQWGRSGRRLPVLPAGSSSPTDQDLPWASPASARSTRQETDT